MAMFCICVLAKEDGVLIIHASFPFLRIPNITGDLFDMLLPMLSIYQEYVRNHHYSLQVLTECKSNPAFATVLKRLEAKSVCQGRSLETFLTYPMHQVGDQTIFPTVYVLLTVDFLCLSADSPVHHHVARIVGAYAARPCRTQKPPKCSTTVGGLVAAYARRSLRNGEFAKELGR